MAARFAVPDTDPSLAVMVVCPEARPAATPFGKIVATPSAEELQVAEEVKFCWLPSLNVPVATKGWMVPTTMLGLEGVTAIDKSVAESTVNSAEALSAPAAAVIVV